MKTAIELVQEEVNRQINDEGFTPEHDDSHAGGELALAAAAYAVAEDMRLEYNRDDVSYPSWWPWESKWWKPTPNDRIKELVKSGALIAQEIARLQRLKQK